MKLSTSLQLVAFSLATLILISVFTAFSAGIWVSNTTVGTGSASVTPNRVKPPACDGLNLTNIVTGAGTVTGTSGNDLILGSSGDDTIDGLGGDDCILGGEGDDVINGNSNTDICLGGQGADTFIACESITQ